MPCSQVTSLCPPTARDNPASIACTPRADNASKFAAYRLHVGDDPLLFEGGSLQTWRNGDERGCPWPASPLAKPPALAPLPHGRAAADAVVNATSYALVYEWA